MTSNLDSETLTPTQLNRLVRGLLESHFDFVWIDGEISNFARPSSGHWYFSLKDDSAQVRCAMFKNKNQRLRFQPENGDQVRLRARVSLYEGRGEFQLIGEFMEPAGAGALQARFEALRDKLQQEGLFDRARKQDLPTGVDHIAVITSPTGAVLQDILQVLARRNPAIRVTVIPAAVQGEAAAAELRNAIITANLAAKSDPDADFDAIILARGGGSLEDLWPFNDEELARTIDASALPVISGVGHEVDITIADFAADHRAPTPSAAAELLSEDSAELLARLRERETRLRQAILNRLERERLRLETLSSRLRHPGDKIRERAQKLDDLEQRLNSSIQTTLTHQRSSLALLAQKLQANSPGRKLAMAHDQLSQLERRLRSAIDQHLAQTRSSLKHRANLLDSLNPLAILERGFAVILDERGGVVRDSANLSVGQALRAKLAKGEIQVTVSDPDPGALGDDA